MRWLLAEKDDAGKALSKRFREVAEDLDPSELQVEPSDGFDLTDEDVMDSMGTDHRGSRLLDYYSKAGVELALERYAVLPELRARGYSDLEVVVDPSDTAHQVVRVRGRTPRDDDAGGPKHVLAEAVVRRGEVSLPDETGGQVPVLLVEWLMLQDPTAAFTADHPQLPGQERPGLGLAREVRELLVQACLRLGLHGVAFQPAHYHNAAVARGGSRFVDPAREGRFRAIAELMLGRPIVEATRIVDEGRLIFTDGTKVSWEPSAQVIPVSDRLKQFLSSKAYEAAVEAQLLQDRESGLHIRGAPEGASQM